MYSSMYVLFCSRCGSTNVCTGTINSLCPKRGPVLDGGWGEGGDRQFTIGPECHCLFTVTAMRVPQTVQFGKVNVRKGQVRQGKGHSTRSRPRGISPIKLLHSSSSNSTISTIRVRTTLSPQNSPSGHHHTISYKTNDLSLSLSLSPQTSQVLAKPDNPDIKHNPSFFLSPLMIPLLPFHRNLHPEENPRFTLGALHPSLYHSRCVYSSTSCMQACDHLEIK